MVAISLALALALGSLFMRRHTKQTHIYDDTATSEAIYERIDLDLSSTQAVHEFSSTSASPPLPPARGDNQEDTTTAVTITDCEEVDLDPPPREAHVATSMSSPFLLPQAHEVRATTTPSIEVQENPTYGPTAPHVEVEENLAYGPTAPHEENSSYELQSPWLCP